MKLIFENSTLQQLIKAVTDNPTAIGVIITNAELVAIYDELIATNNSGCVMISGNDKTLYIDQRWIKIVVKNVN